MFEQRIELAWEDQRMQVRRIVVHLNQPTRDGDTDIAMLTSLPTTIASAVEVAQLYRNRWTIENFFQSVTLNFEGKSKPLLIPKQRCFPSALP